MAGLQAQRERGEVDRRVTTGQEVRSGIDGRASVDGGWLVNLYPYDQTSVGDGWSGVRQIQAKITRDVQSVVLVVARLSRGFRRAGVLILPLIVRGTGIMRMSIAVRVTMMVVMAAQMDVRPLIVVIGLRSSHRSMRMRHRKPLYGHGQHQQDGKETLQHVGTHSRYTILQSYVRNPPQAMTLADRRPPTLIARQMNRPQSIAAAIAAITPSSMNVTFDIGRLNTVPRQAH